MGKGKEDIYKYGKGQYTAENAYREGWEAYNAGWNLSDNPFKGENQSATFRDAWARGWTANRADQGA